MGPVRLHSPALRGPVVSIPNRAVHAHQAVNKKRRKKKNEKERKKNEAKIPVFGT
jgi:hypothetical protein